MYRGRAVVIPCKPRGEDQPAGAFGKADDPASIMAMNAGPGCWTLRMKRREIGFEQGLMHLQLKPKRRHGSAATARVGRGKPTAEAAGRRPETVAGGAEGIVRQTGWNLPARGRNCVRDGKVRAERASDAQADRIGPKQLTLATGVGSQRGTCEELTSVARRKLCDGYWRLHGLLDGCELGHQPAARITAASG